MARRLVVQILVLALGFAVAQTSRAACTVDPCVSGGSANFDCDRDGYTDLEECTGLSTAGGAAFAYPSCRVDPARQPACLDPQVPDLFVKFDKASPSAYDELGITNDAAFGFITQPVSSGGLGMRVHVVPAGTVLSSTPQPNSVTPRMPALWVLETRGSPSASCPISSPLGAVNGVTSVGGSAVAQIYTQRILDHVSCVYSSAGVSPTSPAAIADKITMIRHTTAHEATHLNRLAPDPVDRFGGNHYRAGSGCVMDQASTYSTKGGKVTFSTPTTYCGPDQAAIAAGETSYGNTQCGDPSDVLDQDGFVNNCLPATP